MVLPLLAAATIGSGVLGAISGNSAAKKAAAASQYATDQSIGLQREQFNQTQANLAPYMQAGQAGLPGLQQRATDGGGVYGNTANPTLDSGSYAAPQAFSYGAADYTASPGLDFAIKRGVGAINSQAAANGSMYSGKTLKDVGTFVADSQLKDFQNERAFAAGQYTDQRNFGRANFLDDRNYDTGRYDQDRNYLTNRYDQQTGVLQNLTNVGANAAAGVGNAGMAYANNAGQALQQNAANQGNAGLVASSNFSSLLGQGVNALAYTMRPPAAPSYSTNASYGFS